MVCHCMVQGTHGDDDETIDYDDREIRHQVVFLLSFVVSRTNAVVQTQKDIHYIYLYT